MALLNFLKPGTYSFINTVRYRKSEKLISFILEIYEDSTKRKRFMQREFSFYCTHRARSLTGRDITLLPEIGKKGDIFHVSKEKSRLCGVLIHYPGTIAVWSEVKEDWDFWALNDGEIFFDETNKVFLKHVQGKWTEVKIVDDSRMWENYFGPEKALLPDDVSLHGEIYKYLLSLPEFKNCLNG